MPYSKVECVEAVQRATQIVGHSPSAREYRYLNITPSVSYLQNEFGSFNKAKEAAGVATENPPKRFSKQDCVNSLIEASEDLGHSPTYNEYVEGGYTPTTPVIEDRCGSFNAAKEIADLDTADHYQGFRQVNETYFAEVDSDPKAYWLGFLLGDGSVNSHGSQGFKCSLKISEKDKNHLQQFCHDIDSTYPIRERTTKRGHTRVEVQITNPTFCEFLIDRGIKPRKMYNGSSTDVPNRLFPSFIRGFFDADGSCSGNVWRITQVQRKPLDQVQDYLENCGIEVAIYECSQRNESERDYHNLQTTSISTIGKIVDLCWPDGSNTEPMLERKFQRLP